MDEKTLQDILALNYGIESPSLEFLREGGAVTYIVNGSVKYQPIFFTIILHDIPECRQADSRVPDR